MRQVRDLIGAQGAAAAGMIGPAKHSRLEEGAIDDQLSAALEQVEQANLTRRPFELVLLLHRRPRHPATLSGQCITGVSEGLLLHEHLLACSLPLLLRNDWGCLHRRLPFRVLLLLIFHFHFSLLFRFWMISSDPFFLREIFKANAATPPIEAVPTTTDPMVAKQNGHIVHLLGGNFTV